MALHVAKMTVSWNEKYDEEIIVNVLYDVQTL